MRIVVVDDEPLARDRLCRLLAELPGYEVVGTASCGAEALQVIDDEEPDVVLLDIRMDPLDGLQVARRLAQHDPAPAIVFTTAYQEHALSAFDVRAAAYLLKPVRLERLRETLGGLRRQHRAQLRAQAASDRGAVEFVTVQLRDGIRRIPVADIVCFVADSKYTSIHHLHGEDLTEEPLKAFEDQLGAEFLRVHRKALVARRYVQSLERSREAEDGYWLRLRHAREPVPVARRRVAELRRQLAAPAGSKQGRATDLDD